SLDVEVGLDRLQLDRVHLVEARQAVDFVETAEVACPPAIVEQDIGALRTDTPDLFQVIFVGNVEIELTLDADGQRLRIDCYMIQNKLPALRSGHLKQRQLGQVLDVSAASARFPTVDNLACACLAAAVNALELFLSRSIYIQLAHSRRCSKENRVPA